jgi:hypothetical protein
MEHGTWNMGRCGAKKAETTNDNIRNVGMIKSGIMNGLDPGGGTTKPET